MNIHKYKVLLHTVDCGNMSQAAQELDYTQSGISHMMKSLENYFGFPLLTRTRTGIRLTRNGEEIMPYIRALVRANEALDQKASGLRGLVDGKISIGAYTSITVAWLMPVIQAFHAGYPHIQISLFSGTTEELERMLKEHRLDLAFFTNSGQKDLECRHVKDDPMLAIVPPDDPLANESSFPLAWFEKHHFILPSPRGADEAIQIIRQANVILEYPYLAPNRNAAMAMVENGLGYSIIPELTIKTTRCGAVAIPLDPPQHRELCLFLPLDDRLSPAAREFVEYFDKIIPRLLKKG